MLGEVTVHPSSIKYPEEYVAAGKNNMYRSALNAGEVTQKSKKPCEFLASRSAIARLAAKTRQCAVTDR